MTYGISNSLHNSWFDLLYHLGVKLKRRVRCLEPVLLRKMLIWPKHIVSWICGLISSDGTITSNQYHKIRIDRINITCGVYPEWIKHVRDVLRENTIGTSINGPYKNKPTSVVKPHPLSPGCYYLRLNKYFPKNRRSGFDQYQVFRNSIEYWGLQNLIVKRKYEVLCEITKPPPSLSEAKTQQKLEEITG